MGSFRGLHARLVLARFSLPVIPAQAGIQFLARFLFVVSAELSLALRATELLFGIAPKSNQKGLAPTAVVRFASCESNCPVLLGAGGVG